MSDQFMDTSNLLGVMPRTEDSADATEEIQDQVETEATDESDDPGQDQAEMDASKEDSQTTNDTDDSSEEEEQQDEQPDVDELNHQLQVVGRDRSEWQRKYDQAESDNRKLIDALDSRVSGNGLEATKPSTSKTMDKLNAMEGDDLLDAGTLKEVLGGFIAEQQADRDAAQQKNQIDDLNSRMSAELRAKPDLREVTQYFKQHLSDSPEASMMTNLGLYYFASGKMLDQKNKEAFKAGKTEGAKSATGRQERLNKLPSQAGTQGQRVSSEADPSGILDIMKERRIARGIRTDGSIR